MTEEEAPSGVLINTSLRPRVLVLGFDGEDQLIADLLALGATSKLVSSLREVRTAEWDVLISDRLLDWLPQDLFFVFRAAPIGKSSRSSMSLADGSVNYYANHVCAELIRI